LKVEEGSVVLGASMPGEMVILKDETGFAGREIEREMLNTIVHCRVRETFELLKRQLDDASLGFLAAGLLLTGGCSMLKGIDQLAAEIFGMPVHLTHAQTVSGITSAFENPQYSTAIGLIKYAQAMQGDKPRAGLIRRFWRKLPFFGVWLIWFASSIFSASLFHNPFHPIL
jgi:cell division protein FtsA